MDASWVHFDISLVRKRMALKEGAVLTDRYGSLEYTAKLVFAAALTAGDEDSAAMAQRTLQRIAKARVRLAARKAVV